MALPAQKASIMNITVRLWVISALLVLAPACGKHVPPGKPSTPAKIHAMEPYPVDVAALPRKGNCVLESVNGELAAGTAVSAIGVFLFGGWMGDASGTVPTDARLALATDGVGYSVPLIGDIERTDVARALSQPGLTNARFNVAATLAVKPGRYDMYIVYGAEHPLACPLNAALTVRP
jgi:hypothetical protein